MSSAGCSPCSSGASPPISSGSNPADSAVPSKSSSDEQEVDIVINNVVCSFSVRCHLNLREIALRGLNVEYKKENGVSRRSRSRKSLGSIY